MKTLFLTLLMITSSVIFGQSLTQTLRGNVSEKFSAQPVPNAAIQVTHSNGQTFQTVSDIDGNFRLEAIPVGRLQIEVSSFGFASYRVTDVDHNATRETVLQIELKESLNELSDITVVSNSSVETRNEMVTVSARTFSIEETQRFAGARNDVARMAAKLPGVRSTNDAVNDIVIRGNSPNGLLWRLDDLDIPNPNHYGKNGQTGGPVSMLNNNVLRNSDFLTGAFPASYGNALSGVFDLQMRNGNNEKHEFLGQIGFNGLEAGAEGPLGNGSYLVNYRYSVLGFMSALGFDFGTGSAVPEYQDVTFKVHQNLSSKMSMNVFGLWGKSKIDFVRTSDEDDDDLYGEVGMNTYSRTQQAVLGVNFFYKASDADIIKLTLGTGTLWDNDYVDTIDGTGRAHSFYGMDFRNTTYSANVHWTRHLNAKNDIKAGVRNNFYNFDMLDSVYSYSDSKFVNPTNSTNGTSLHQPYVEWQYRPTERWTFNTGLHSQILALNGVASIEPRVGAEYALNEKNTLSAAYGLHSQMAPVNIYYRNVDNGMGGSYQPNQDLNFQKSHHFVVGHSYMFSPTLRLKTEVYYQQLYDAIVEEAPSPFSMLNGGTFGGIPNAALSNDGEGRNYGIELSLEQYLNKGFYLFSSISIYNSEYLASDQIWRKGAYAGDYVGSISGGKEFVLTKDPEAKLRQSITVDGSINVAGGQRYTPIDLAASAQEGRTVYIEDEAYSLQLPTYFRTDLRIAYRIQGKKTTQEWAIDVQNLTNRKNVQNIMYDPIADETVEIYNIGILPMFQWRIYF